MYQHGVLLLVSRNDFFYIQKQNCFFLFKDLINHPDLPMKRATVQCLHVMTTHGKEFWHPLLETGFKKKQIN
jgi:hypothetical protein